MHKFSTNQIVKGKVCGHFVVLGYRYINGNLFVQVKPYCLETKKVSRGEIAFTEDALTEVV